MSHLDIIKDVYRTCDEFWVLGCNYLQLPYSSLLNKSSLGLIHKDLAGMPVIVLEVCDLGHIKFQFVWK